MPGREPDVPEMIRRAHAGDSEILGRLLAGCKQRLRLRVHGQIRATVAARCDAADIMQQSLMEAVRSFKSFRGETEAELLIVRVTIDTAPDVGTSTLNVPFPPLPRRR